MDYIPVTFQHDNISDDLKVPTFIPVEELVKIFGEIYGVEGTTLHAEPKGIILNKNKTLEEQSILHGAKLTVA
jgi:uncharacterized ubiquitin-like protein YukD